ncbi:MAG: hypothetical protein methR_P3646 [Methyloprofundus sp.]|nr:MAG: hypothetical protein methR_P3646 [Methyloprofundus sp.]
MNNKVEVHPATEQEGGGYWVIVCINVGSYFKHMQHTKVHCSDEQALATVVANAFNNKICPECGHIFSTHGWDGIDAHWRANHEQIISYENAWKLISTNKYIEVMLASAE